ncbi:MAG: hypothetical protein JXR07_20465 [Reichenbachiella sp.]
MSVRINLNYYMKPNPGSRRKRFNIQPVRSKLLFRPKKEDANIFKTIPPYLTVGYVGIIILGLVYQILYYDNYDIKIPQYLELSEIIFVTSSSFLEIISVIVMASFYQLIISYLFQLIIFRLPIISHLTKAYISALIPGLIASIIILVVIAIETEFRILVYTGFGVFIGGGFELFYSSGWKNGTVTNLIVEKWKTATKYLVIAFVFTVLFDGTYLVNYPNRPTTEVQIMFTDRDMLNTNDKKHTYVGESRNFIFLYMKDQKKSVVIPRSRITEMTYKVVKKKETIFEKFVDTAIDIKSVFETVPN